MFREHSLFFVFAFIEGERHVNEFIFFRIMRVFLNEQRSRKQDIIECNECIICGHVLRFMIRRYNK
ncbi:unnamed protein product [Haemonchus placei]|uniref:Uncharacterized protein n=1 Tax=Haemonchus placei TaxID=6290 RepID=A0A0N4VVM9_HAEPC|nr:unnamed protein product [Haemonchus placei]